MITPLVIPLPYPDPDLHPNGRPDPWRRAAKTKAYRETCQILARSEINRRAKVGRPFELAADGPIPVRLVFHAKVNRRRDRDGALSSAKALLDGLADALKVNDARFVPETVWGELRPPFGAVVAEVGP